MQEIILTENGLISGQSMTLIEAVEKETAAMIQKRDMLRAALLDAMEKHNIKKFENDDIVISYIAPTDRERFDSKALREDMPDVYEAYAAIHPVKSSVRVRLK